MLKQQLLKIIRAVEIHSPTTFSLAGTLISSKSIRCSAGQNPLVEALMRNLYFDCYCRPFKGRVTVQPRTPRPSQDFLSSLSAANTSSDYLNCGWLVHSVLPTGHCIVEKNGSVRTVLDEEFILLEGVSAAPGAKVGISCLKESTTMRPGFYYIFGTALTDQQDDDDLLRFYWNVKAVGVLSLIRLLTLHLNRFQIPFRLKCVNNPRNYNRTDAAVLYFNKRFYHIGVELVADTYREIKQNLGLSTPLFSKPLAAGLGFAEQPENGASFGQHRCRILAEALVEAYEQNLVTEAERLAEVERQFERKGLDFARPYLNAGSTDRYEFPAAELST
jgi:hypothetical protein